MTPPLVIDLRDTTEPSIHIDRELPLDDLSGLGDERIEVRSATLEARGERSGSRMDLRGRLVARLLLGCSRCLERYETALDVPFFLVLVPAPAGGAGIAAGDREAPPGRPREAVVEDDDAALFEAPGGRADLRRLATEQLYLNLPLKPVCHEGCRGLCATCGANRNRIECGCCSETADPRLAVLLDLKRQMRRS